MSSNVQRIAILFTGLLLATAACGPAYMTAAAQPARSIRGPLAPVIDQAPGGDTGYTGSLGIGLGNRHLGFEGQVHALNIGKGTFAAPVDAAMGRWATVQTTMEARWTFLRWGRFGIQARGGGTHAAIVDKMSGDRSWGIGYTYGAGVELQFKNVTFWANASETRLRFMDGPATGASYLRGVTLGVALWR
jgi:hypothetical protein